MAHSAQQSPASVGSKTSIDLSGIYPPIATPFKDGGEEIDYEKLRENFEKWNEIPFRGYVVQGTNGEYAYLDEREKISLVTAARQMASKDKLIISGSGCESTKATINLCRELSRVGADAFLVLPPFYFKSCMHQEALYQHYVKVADASEKPIIVYNMPGNTGLDLDSNLIARLAVHPNIVGVKESGGDVAKMTDILYKTRGTGFQVLAGSTGFLLPALSIGSVGAVCALANVLGREVCQLYEYYKGGQVDMAREMQLRLVGPNAAVTKKFSVPGLKYSMDMKGFYGGPCRPPLTSLSGSDQKSIDNIFLDSGF